MLETANLIYGDQTDGPIVGRRNGPSVGMRWDFSEHAASKLQYDRLDTGKAIAPVIAAPGAAERSGFLKIVCGMRDAEFGKYFVQAAFTGKDVTPPREVLSGRDVKSIVAGSPGAIGFIRALDFHGDGSD